jgi:hypothetical protein
MPYEIRGGHVINARTGKPVNKKPLPHARLVKLLRALYANVKEAK